MEPEPLNRNHWRYGRSCTIGDAPEASETDRADAMGPPSPTVIGNQAAATLAQEQPPASLYSYRHGMGQRLGEASAPSSDTTIATAINDTQSNIPDKARTPAPVFSFELDEVVSQVMVVGGRTKSERWGGSDTSMGGEGLLESRS